MRCIPTKQPAPIAISGALSLSQPESARPQKTVNVCFREPRSQQFRSGGLGDHCLTSLYLVEAVDEAPAARGEVEEAIGAGGVKHDPRDFFWQVAVHLEACHRRVRPIVAP